MNTVLQPTPIKVERRFPLDLHQSDTATRQLYETAKVARWEPDTAVPWKDFNPSAFQPEDLTAARHVWSRRAWIESGGLSETPALLIRFCLELDREADPKYFLSVRNTEEAWHLECFHRYAEACGGYLERPANPAWEPLFNRRLYRDALHAEMAIDDYVVTHCAFVDGLEYELAQAWLANTREPVARALLEHCVADRERHAKFGWLYAARRAAGLSAEQRAGVGDSLARHIETVEFAGYNCVALGSKFDVAPDVEDLRRVSDSGLGGVTATAEVEVFTRYLASVRARLAELGCALPGLRHPALGPM